MMKSLRLESSDLCIQLTKFYPHLQHVILCNNEITELSPFLDEMAGLVVLNVSNNKLTSLLDYKMKVSPLNIVLTEANYENNLLSTFSSVNLTTFSATLKRLNIAYNDIAHDLAELNVLVNLVDLNISHNNITRLNLNNLKHLKYLNAESNQLNNINGIPAKALQQLNLKNNEIDDLLLFLGLKSLYKLNLENNKLEQFEQIEYLKELNYLYDLCLLGNPFIMEGDDLSLIYKYSIIYRVPQITTLDAIELGSEEKVRAINFFTSSDPAQPSTLE